MGHVIPGSRENYFSRERPEDIEEQYMKTNFSREVPEGKLEIQARQIRELQKELREVDPLMKDIERLCQLPGYREFLSNPVADAKAKLAERLRLQQIE